MSRRSGGATRMCAVVMVAALFVTACAGSPDTSNSETATSSTGEATEPPPSATLDASNKTDIPDDTEQASASGSGVAGDSTVAVPIARFTAHGPQAANTIGPGCAEGVDTRGGDVFRFTPPAAWAWQGTSGGTGYDEVTLTADDVRMTVTEASYDYEKEALNEFEIIGPSGVDVDIDGVAVPIIEVTLAGSPGYAIVDLPYLEPLPLLDNGALGTIVLTSDAEAGPTIDEATELLGSVRVERCAAVGESLIWGPGVGVNLVPRFEPDPLGKTYPDQPQPAFEPTKFVLGSYSLEQIAYLMPVAADVAMCAAAKAVEFGTDNPIGHFSMFIPNGTNKVDIEAIVAAC